MWAWPGLRGGWQRGSWRDACVAIGFANLLVIVILTTFVWPETVERGTWAVVCLLGATLWVAFVVGQVRGQLSAGECDRQGASRGGPLFQAAQTEYLRGDWGRAEQHLARLLRLTPHDLEARLLWASLLRRRGRPEPARQHLKSLEQADLAGKWSVEIANERQQLSQLEQESQLIEAA